MRGRRINARLVAGTGCLLVAAATFALARKYEADPILAAILTGVCGAAVVLPLNAWATSVFTPSPTLAKPASLDQLVHQLEHQEAGLAAASSTRGLAEDVSLVASAVRSLDNEFAELLQDYANPSNVRSHRRLGRLNERASRLLARRTLMPLLQQRTGAFRVAARTDARDDLREDLGELANALEVYLQSLGKDVFATPVTLATVHMEAADLRRKA